MGASLRFWGAATVAVIMVGAIGTHLMNNEFEMVPVPGLLLGLSILFGVHERAQGGTDGHAPQ